MPERWENELRKLRRVERPSTLEDRVAEGPRHEPGRPTRERVAAAVVAFAVCAAVGAVGYRAVVDDDGAGGSHVATGIPSGDDPLVLELTSDDAQPTATIWYENEGQDGVLEGYNWCPDGATGQEQCTSAIADFAFYPPPNEFLVVRPGTPIEVTGDGSVERLAFENVCDLHAPMPCPTAASRGDRVVPTDDGRYAIKVEATWPQGDATVWFGIQVLSSEAAVPDVLTVDCSFGLVRTDTSVVRTTPHGLHVSFIAGQGSRAFEILSADGELYGVGDADARSQLAARPGAWAVGCGRDVDVANAAPFELVDPDDHYAPWDLACGNAPQTSFTSTVPSSHPHDVVIGELLWNLAPDDRIRGAGYAADLWRLGPTYVVQRDGAAVVRVVLAEDGGTWSGTIEACDGSGITLSDRIVTTGGGGSGPSGPDATGSSGATGTTGATEPADRLVVRCEGLGPALETASVRLQAGGRLDIEATNVADAEVLVIEADDLSVVAHFGFEEVTTRGDAGGLEPGLYWAGCRVYDEETGEVEGDHTTVPDAYARFEVAPEDA